MHSIAPSPNYRQALNSVLQRQRDAAISVRQSANTPSRPAPKAVNWPTLRAPITHISKTFASIRSYFHTHPNIFPRIICIGLLVFCAFVCFTGRGVVSIVQGVVGVIFAVEGFWACVKCDLPAVKKFMAFLPIYNAICIAVSVANLFTVNTYCSAAITASDSDTCHDQAMLYAYVTLGLSLGALPGMFAVIWWFHRLLSRRYKSSHISSVDIHMTQPRSA